MPKKLNKVEQLAADKQYMQFLQKRLASKNFKSNVTEEEFDKTKAKYDKVKLRIKLLYPNIKV